MCIRDRLRLQLPRAAVLPPRLPARGNPGPVQRLDAAQLRRLPPPALRSRASPTRTLARCSPQRRTRRLEG
eukprot:6543890-Alexandrium_andersonii.AAC.1